MIHEILNGFAEHADATKAFSTPVAPIPTGSGNGLSLNLLGPEVIFQSLPGLCFSLTFQHCLQEGFDVLAAALNAIKGERYLSSTEDVLTFPFRAAYESRPLLCYPGRKAINIIHVPGAWLDGRRRHRN